MKSIGGLFWTKTILDDTKDSENALSAPQDLIQTS